MLLNLLLSSDLLMLVENVHLDVIPVSNSATSLESKLFLFQGKNLFVLQCSEFK